MKAPPLQYPLPNLNTIVFDTKGSSDLNVWFLILNELIFFIEGDMSYMTLSELYSISI